MWTDALDAAVWRDSQLAKVSTLDYSCEFDQTAKFDSESTHSVRARSKAVWQAQ